MPPLTMNLQGRDGQFPYTRAVYFSSLQTAQNYGLAIGALRSGSLFVLVRGEFFDKGHAVDCVQGRSTAENLWPDRFSRPPQSFSPARAAYFSPGPQLNT